MLVQTNQQLLAIEKANKEKPNVSSQSPPLGNNVRKQPCTGAGTGY
jgi:hypothetical protein